MGVLPLTSPDELAIDQQDVASPWAMQLVMRVHKREPPTRAALCEAAATAVVRLLADPRSDPGGPWGPSVRRWVAGPIRKLARRAKGVAWDRVQALDGITVDHDGAQVRALVPGPVDPLPRELARLPLTGSEVPEVGPAERGLTVAGPVLIAICPTPALSLGKAVAAAGHAAQLALISMPARRRGVWAADGFPVAVAHPGPRGWADLMDAAPVRVVDGGLTEVEPGTTTALACWA